MGQVIYLPLTSVGSTDPGGSMDLPTKTMTVDVSDVSDFGNGTALTELTTTIPATKKYKFKFFLFVNSAVQSVLRLQVVGPAGFTYIYAGVGGQSSGSGQLTETPDATIYTSQYVSTQAGDFTLCEYTAVVQNGATDGDFTVKAESGSGTVIIKAGSFVEITDVTPA